MTSVFWKLLFVVCVIGSFSTLASYSYGVITPIHHNPKTSRSDIVPAKEVVLTRDQPAHQEPESRYKLEIPFGCDDKGCLTAWAERPHKRISRTYAGAIH